MTLRQYIEGLWALGIDDIRFRQDPEAVLKAEYDTAKIDRLAALMKVRVQDALAAFVLGALAAMHEASEIAQRYISCAAGYDGPNQELPLELAIGSLAAQEYFFLLSQPLRDALIYLSMRNIYKQMEYVLMKDG